MKTIIMLSLFLLLFFIGIKEETKTPAETADLKVMTSLYQEHTAYLLNPLLVFNQEFRDKRVQGVKDIIAKNYPVTSHESQLLFLILNILLYPAVFMIHLAIFFKLLGFIKHNIFKYNLTKG